MLSYEFIINSMTILLNLMITSTAAVTGLLGLSDGALNASVSDVVYSVETALAEQSPRGEMGGLAVPASGGSNTCSLSINPNPVTTGSGATASWSHSTSGGGGESIGQAELPWWKNLIAKAHAQIGGDYGSSSVVLSLKLWRCNSGTNCTGDPSTGSGLGGFAGDGGGSTGNWALVHADVAQTQTGEVCTGGTMWNPRVCENVTTITYAPPASGSTDAETSGLAAGNYLYRLITYPNHHKVQCDTTLTVEDEEIPEEPTECEDGIDNDGDGLIDWSSDPDCVGDPDDPDESGITATLEVRNDTTGSGWTGNNITIDPDEQVSLRWSSTGSPNSCSGSGSGFSTGGATGGIDSTITEPSAGNTNNYTVVCNKTGAAPASDSLNVTTRAPVDIDADPKVVYQGEQSTVTWSTGSADPASCSVTGPEINLPTLSSSSGSEVVDVNGESTYTIDCGVSGTDSVTIRVLPVIQET